MTRRAGVLVLAVGVLGGYLGLSQACSTVAVQALDLATAEFRAHAITVNVAGIEIFGFPVRGEPPGHRPRRGQGNREPGVPGEVAEATGFKRNEQE